MEQKKSQKHIRGKIYEIIKIFLGKLNKRNKYKHLEVKMKKILLNIIIGGTFFWGTYLSASNWKLQKELYDAINS